MKFMIATKSWPEIGYTLHHKHSETKQSQVDKLEVSHSLLHSKIANNTYQKHWVSVNSTDKKPGIF